MHTMSGGYKHNSDEEAPDTLRKILANPEEYLTHPVLSKIAEKLIVKEEMESHAVELKAEGIPYKVIVHRKGATPAGKDVLGIIPGSVTAPGFIVKGKGEPCSLNSASHGAGRQMSRTKALANITRESLNKELETHGVKLIGGGLDEAPFAYKDIREVMKSQTELVDVLGSFHPKIVQMDGTAPRRNKFRRKKPASLSEGE